MVGYDDDGFIKKTLTEIILEKENQAKNIFDLPNYSISDPLWQWLKIVCQERLEIETMNEIAAYMFDIRNAVGAFLDKHGIECGLPRKGSTKAQGYVEMVVNMDGASISIIAGTRFSSALNDYTSDAITIAPLILEMTKSKSGISYDYFPTYIDQIEATVSEPRKGIVEIKLDNGDVVGVDVGSPDDYSVDLTYLNNIIWAQGSSAYLDEGEKYTVKFIGNMTIRIEVSSEETGDTVNALIGDVTNSKDFPQNAVTNKAAITGGLVDEIDANYRERLLSARRRNFTLGSIKDIILGLEGVRSAKVYQSVGVDQTSIADWDNKNTGQSIKVTGQRPLYSQSFVPGNLVATLGKITLWGKPYGLPPAIYLGVKADDSNNPSYATGIYFDYIKVERTDLDPAIEGFKDIPFNLIYNDLDKTKTYRFDIWSEDPGGNFDWDDNYWELATTTGYKDDVRGTLFSIDNATGYNNMHPTDIVFKTHFKGAGFNAVVATDDGYGFNNIKIDIETYLDYVEKGGYSPICIQPYITEAEEKLINVKATIYISELADFSTVRIEIEDSIETYLENLDVGDNVVYAKIHHEIMKHPQVTNLKELSIKRADIGSYGELDLPILDSEIPDLGSSSFQRG